MAEDDEGRGAEGRATGERSSHPRDTGMAFVSPQGEVWTQAYQSRPDSVVARSEMMYRYVALREMSCGAIEKY